VYRSENAAWWLTAFVVIPVTVRPLTQDLPGCQRFLVAKVMPPTGRMDPWPTRCAAFGIDVLEDAFAAP
jgi:hypothetical protein